MTRAIGTPKRRSRLRHDPDRSLVGFIVADVHYAVRIETVREIIVPVPLAQLPHLPAAVAGVADHRGDVIPVIDLRKRFGAPEGEPSSRTKWILIRTPGGDLGLAVDAITDVFGTAGQPIRSAPNVDGAMEGVVLGVTSYEDSMVFVLDTSAFDGVVSAVDGGQKPNWKGEY